MQRRWGRRISKKPAMKMAFAKCWATWPRLALKRTIRWFAPRWKPRQSRRAASSWLNTRSRNKDIRHGDGRSRNRGHDSGSLPGRGGGDQDRKSVVSGKSVSVRVALGGRRIIQNKNTQICVYRVY